MVMEGKRRGLRIEIRADEQVLLELAASGSADGSHATALCTPGSAASAVSSRRASSSIVLANAVTASSAPASPTRRHTEPTRH